MSDMPSDDEMAEAFAPFVKNLREAVERRAAYDKADTNSKINASAAFSWMLASLVFGLLHLFDAPSWAWPPFVIIPIMGWLKTAKDHLNIMNANSDPED